MARHSNHEAARRLGDVLTELRESRSTPTERLTFSKIERGLIAILGDSAPTSETVRRLHSGDGDPAGTSPEVLLALARFYEVAPERLGPEVADRVASLRSLLADTGRGRPVTHGLPVGRPMNHEHPTQVRRAS